MVTKNVEGVARPLTAGQAAKLTERIRSSVEATWVLIQEAHERRAWSALGYDTWEGYVAAEFGMSERQSYRLLTQGRVIHELGAAAGVDTAAAPEIAAAVTQRGAEAIAPVLEEVVEKVRTAVKGKRAGKRAAIAAEVVEQERPRPTPSPAARGSLPQPTSASTQRCPTCKGTGQVPKPALAGARRGRSGNGSAPSAADCKHPVGQRIGKHCMACDRDV